MIQKSRICDVLRASCEVTKISVCSMADTNNAVGAPVVVELTEDDIPGAALAEPLVKFSSLSTSLKLNVLKINL